MAIKVVCTCGRSRLFPDAMQGKTDACRKCGAALNVVGERIVPPRVSLVRRVLPMLLVLMIPTVVGVVVYRSRQPRFIPAME